MVSHVKPSGLMLLINLLYIAWKFKEVEFFPKFTTFLLMPARYMIHFFVPGLQESLQK
jgi:hypothetical protein